MLSRIVHPNTWRLRHLSTDSLLLLPLLMTLIPMHFWALVTPSRQTPLVLEKDLEWEREKIQLGVWGGMLSGSVEWSTTVATEIKGGLRPDIGYQKDLLHTDAWRAIFQSESPLPLMGLETHQRMSEASLGVWLPTEIRMSILCWKWQEASSTGPRSGAEAEVCLYSPS